MDEVKLTYLSNGVEGCHIKNTRFKTTRISLNLMVPLDKNTVCANAILPFILTRACREYPDYTSFNAKLAELYGASIYGDTAKYGDKQVLKLVLTVLDDRFALDGSSIIKESTALLCALLFDPPLVEDSFNSADIDSEKRLFIERIEGEMNDKRKYAIRQTEGIMCKNEPYGIPKYGTKEDAEALTPASIYAAWQNVLKTAFVRVNVIGSSDPVPVFDGITQAFSKISRNYTSHAEMAIATASGETKRKEERMAVSQGKMVMGFRIDVPSTSLEETVAARVMTDLFGGGPYSRLFTNVREKESLCYYCAARYTRQKGIILVDCGIEEDNKAKAEAEILKQLNVMKNGEFLDSELLASKMSITDTAKSVTDSMNGIDGWYSDRLFETNPLSPEDFAARVETLTKDDIVKAAQKVQLDTVYFLGGLNDEADLQK